MMNTPRRRSKRNRRAVACRRQPVVPSGKGRRGEGHAAQAGEAGRRGAARPAAAKKPAAGAPAPRAVVGPTRRRRAARAAGRTTQPSGAASRRAATPAAASIAAGAVARRVAASIRIKPLPGADRTDRARSARAGNRFGCRSGAQDVGEGVGSHQGDDEARPDGHDQPGARPGNGDDRRRGTRSPCGRGQAGRSGSAARRR